MRRVKEHKICFAIKNKENIAFTYEFTLFFSGDDITAFLDYEEDLVRGEAKDQLNLASFIYPFQTRNVIIELIAENVAAKRYRFNDTEQGIVINWPTIMNRDRNALEFRFSYRVPSKK